MSDDSRDFSFRIGGEERPDSVLPIREDVPEIKKVSHRVTRITFLILLLVAAGFAVGYFELKKRFNQIYNEGAQGFSAISQNVEVRFSSLLKEQEQLKETLTGQLRSLEKRTDALRAALKKAEKQIAAVEASKAGKKELNASVSKIGSDVAAARKDLAELSKRIPLVEKQLSSEISQVADAIRKMSLHTTRIQEELQALSQKKMDKAIFDVKWKTGQQSFQEQLGQTAKDWNTRFQSLEKRLETLEKRPAPAPPEPVLPTPPAEAPSAPPAPDKIKEEPLKE